MICRSALAGIAGVDSPAACGHCPSSVFATSHVEFRPHRNGSASLSSRVLRGVALKSKLMRNFGVSPISWKPAICTAGIGDLIALFKERLVPVAMPREESLSLRVSETDLLVVGPGVLGSLVAQLWLKGNEGTTVVGQTNTTAHHEGLKSLGIVPVVKDSNSEEKFPYVLFCAPPSGNIDYTAEVRAAAQRWNGEGSLLFTSSSSLYDVSDNSVCDEKNAPSVPKGRGPRTDKLLNAEAEILQVGGNVLRLAGLYTQNRGPHMFYLSKGSVEARPDHLLNLIHYEDAATLCAAILNTEGRGQIFMGCDNNPVSRQELMDAINKSEKYEEKFKEFTGVDGPLGRKMNNNHTRLVTGWKPNYDSFLTFLGFTTAKH